MAEYDVIVVGGGNAAFCAALAAQEQGAKVVVLEAAPEDEAGGNSRFTAGSIRVVYNGVDDIKTLIPDLTAEGDRGDRLRHLHRRPVLRRHGAGHAEPRQSRPGRAPGDAQLRHAELDAREGRALHPDLRPAGVQDRRQVQVLGRPDGRSPSAAARASSRCSRSRAKKRGIEIRYQTRALSLIHDGDRVEGVRVRHDGKESEIRGKAVVLAVRRLPGQSGMAHALSRPGLGPRQGARHPLQHRRRHPHGARDRRQPVRQLVGLPRRAVGDERAGVRRPRGRRPVPEALLSVRDAGQRRPASASSTRAPTSATTPMRSTAAWCWSSRASSPGRCSTRRSSTCSATNTASARSPR